MADFHVLSMGHAHPRTVITNAFLEGLGVGASEEWIRTRIGIRERRTVLPLAYIQETLNREPRLAIEVMDATPTDLAVLASMMAMERAGIDAARIGLVVADNVTSMETMPAEAQKVAGRLGIQAPAFDVNGACPAFALHLDWLSRMREDALPDLILGISTATFTTVIDYTNPSDSAILGDGAAAWILSPRLGGPIRVIEASYATDPSRWEAIVLPRYGHFRQDGRAVRSFSVRQTVAELRRLQARHQLDWSRDRFVGHQANAVMLESVCQACGIPEESHWKNVEEYGNQAGAGAPAVISMRWNDLKHGERIAVAVVGAGLGWGAVLMEVV